MEIKTVKALWPEDVDFVIDRSNIGDQYIFLHYHTPVEVLTINGTLKTSGHTFMFVDKFSKQKYRVIEQPMIHDWMHFTGDLNPLMDFTKLKYNTIYEIAEGDFITKTVQDMEIEKLRNDEFSGKIMETKLTELILLLGRMVNTHREASVDTKVIKKFTDIRTHIHQTYYDNWTVESMAKLLHLSPSRFYELYKKIFAISPKKDLQNLRIEHAKHLLLKKDYTVKEIAEMIGYESEYYFIRKFKEITGRTPGHYMKSK